MTQPRVVEEAISGRSLALAFIGLTALFGLTAIWESGVNVDAVAAAIPGWNLVHDGTIGLQRLPEPSPWFVETADGLVSNRPPGLWLAASLAYLVAAPFTGSEYTNVPATALAVLATAGAVVLLIKALAEILGRTAGWAGGTALVLATPTWTISAAQLWPHGLNQLLIGLGLLAAIRERWLRLGLCFAGLILIRPPLAVAGMVVGLGVAWSHRSWRTVLAIGLPQITAVFGLMLYNLSVFGSFGLAGGYAELTETSAQYRTVVGYLSNLAGTLVSPQSGLLIWAGWTLAATYIGVRLRSTLPAFVRWFALAGAAYLLVHTGFNRYWGGLPYNFRYAIEPITLALPLIVAGLLTALRGTTVQRGAVLVTLGVSGLLQTSDAIFGECQHVAGEPLCRVTGFW